MTMDVKDASTWKNVNELHIKDAGVWKPVNQGYVKDGGVWKQFFNTVIEIDGTSSSAVISYPTNPYTYSNVNVQSTGSSKQVLIQYYNNVAQTAPSSASLNGNALTIEGQIGNSSVYPTSWRAGQLRRNSDFSSSNSSLQLYMNYTDGEWAYYFPLSVYNRQSTSGPYQSKAVGLNGVTSVNANIDVPAGGFAIASIHTVYAYDIYPFVGASGWTMTGSQNDPSTGQIDDAVWYQINNTASLQNMVFSASWTGATAGHLLLWSYEG